MTKEEIESTKEAIRVLRKALERMSNHYKYGIPLDASIPIWNAANYLWRSLPKEDRDF
jgi:hypothetical protein